MDERAPAGACAAALAATVAFGLSFAATKVALQGFRPLLLASLRFTIAGGVLWLVWRARGGRMAVAAAGAEGRGRAGRRRELGRLALLGFVSLTLYFALETNGIARTTASEASVLIATIPVFVGLLAAAFLGERLGVRRWLGVVLSFAGVAGMVALAPATSSCSGRRSPPPSTTSWRGGWSCAAPRST